MRCTFLAVGHGGCTVIETPDGRTLLYDAGAITGPDVTRRIIAPYLWSRGIRRIDEVFLSQSCRNYIRFHRRGA
jgi:competence protein ComEC